MMIEPGCSSIRRITPCQIRKPASVTTNDGTPMSATIEPCTRPITAQMTIAADDRQQPADLVPAAGQLELGNRDGTDAGDVADREVDLAEQEDEDDAEGEHRRARPSG